MDAWNVDRSKMNYLRKLLILQFPRTPWMDPSWRILDRGPVSGSIVRMPSRLRPSGTVVILHGNRRSGSNRPGRGMHGLGLRPIRKRECSAQRIWSGGGFSTPSHVEERPVDALVSSSVDDQGIYGLAFSCDERNIECRGYIAFKPILCML